MKVNLKNNFKNELKNIEEQNFFNNINYFKLKI